MRLAVLLVLLAAMNAATAAHDEAVLRLDGEEVVLAGIETPPHAALCGPENDEWRCGRIAMLALEQRLHAGDVECAPPQASGAARCRVAGEDLGHWLLAAGWARAGDGAPREYLAAEHDARAAKRGIWRNGDGAWRVPDDAGADASCDVCAARHERVTTGAE